MESALDRTLAALVEMAGAEAGHLLAETSALASGWELLASRHEGTETRKSLFSDTILQEAIRTRAPVHISNIVGHAWSGAESVIQARIFSAACFPLIVGDRVFGAAFLMTRTPGRSIRAEVLPELHLFATQAALLLASQIELTRARRENSKLRAMVTEWPSGLIFASSAMSEVARKIEKLAPTPLSVLILGDTGAGKEVVAHELHERSPRAKKPFVALNCAAIPATLLESTLFGHERGAFTGAVRSQPGKFLLADGGTLFLDEIGDLPFELQAKLLRVLQERQIEPIGASRPVAIDIRVLAATHQDLDAAVKAGKFRQDLYFRLAGSTLKIPPLRDRQDDVAPLVRHFLKKLGSPKGLSPEAWTALEHHEWPGNVRELEQVITRAAMLSDGPDILVADLELPVAKPASSANGVQTLGAALVEQSSDLKLRDAQDAFTSAFVAQVLHRNSGNRTAAAHELGISERTLYRLLSPA
ncbi:MAG: sigma-54-dependent Fis family transcriptional regulator, partial [Bdellovibrionota bacterium]